MKKILITAGGTLIAYHISKIANEFFNDELFVEIADTNPSYLVPASTLAKKTHLVPNCDSDNYVEIIKNIIISEKIDIFIPLLPKEQILFSEQPFFVENANLQMVSPSKEIVKKFVDKMGLFKTLQENNISTPFVYSNEATIDPWCVYLVKPRLGFGSQKISIVKGYDIINNSTIYFGQEEYIVQEYCASETYDEVTVEVFNYGSNPRIFARRRLATKAGVCTKMEIVDDSFFVNAIKALTIRYDLPIVFNVQFLYHDKQWKLFDFNPRLAAGTPLSTAAGFQLTKAFLTYLSGKEIDSSLFDYDKTIKSVLRVYEEIVIK